MRVDTQFSAFLVNKPGVLAQITRHLAKGKLNIVAMTLVDSSEHGVLRFVCEEPERARTILKATHDHWTETEVLVMTLPNEPGALASVAETLGTSHINISYGYTSGGAPGGRTSCVFKVADVKKSMKLLGRLTKCEDTPKTRHKEKIRPTPAQRR